MLHYKSGALTTMNYRHRFLLTAVWAQTRRAERSAALYLRVRAAPRWLFSCLEMFEWKVTMSPQVYRHPSCLIKHRWEHTPQWREASKFVLSKHQQVQLLEVITLGSTVDKGANETFLGCRHIVTSFTLIYKRDITSRRSLPLAYLSLWRRSAASRSRERTRRIWYFVSFETSIQFCSGNLRSQQLGPCRISRAASSRLRYSPSHWPRWHHSTASRPPGRIYYPELARDKLPSAGPRCSYGCRR
jgi:hypothetical protein